MRRDATTACASAFIDEFVRAGITDVVLAPGSRSAPLALAAASDDRVTVHVQLDERSAAFFALGIATGTGRPVATVCTSGTAAANFHPAVIEAHHGGIPLLVCTADRPPALRDVGAPQTIDQQHLYGSVLRWFSEIATPSDEPDIGAYWRSIASRACSEAMGTPPGPVHLNFCFAEPLIPTGAELVPAPGRGDGRPWTTHVVGRLCADDALLEHCAHAVRAHPRGFLVSGWGAQVSVATAERVAEAAGWPILADPLSGLRVGVHAISSYEAMLRIPAFAAAARPELVVRVGAPLTSRVANEWLDASVAQILVTADGRANDPQRLVTERIVADPDQFLANLAQRLGAAQDTTWRDALARADVVAQRAIDRLFETWDEPFEGRVARDVVRALPDGTWFAVASSMPVRDVESFAAPRSGVRFVANRGANGIDGFVSTVMGLAQVSQQRVVALLGDLCFLHDVNGLMGAAEREVDVTFVVVDNDGGGIFSFLPQAGHPEHFEKLFATPHGLDLVAISHAYRVPALRVSSAGEVARALRATMNVRGPRILVVPTDRAANVLRHREVWTAVSDALGDQATFASSPQ